MTHSDGTLALVFDDGYVEDYETVRPVLVDRDVPATLAVNPTTLGEAGMLTPGQLRELHEEGWEVASHGHRHRYLRAHPLASDAAAGDRTLALDSDGVFPGEDHGLHPGDCLEVTNGSTAETRAVADTGRRDGTPVVMLRTGLASSFEASGTVARLPDRLLRAEVVGAKRALRKLGYDPTSFVLPYDAGDARAWRSITRNYDALTYTVSPFPNPPDASPLAMGRYYLQTDRLRLPEVTAYLDAVAESGGIGVLAGHSAWDVVTADRLAAVVDAALDRGIEIATLASAVEK